MAKPELEQKPAVQIPELYANTAIVHFNQYEFEVTMGLGGANYEGVRPAVNLRISPQFAKEFARIQMENVTQYEQMVGELPEAEKKSKK